ncbi:MAG: MvdC/MvdD family ATP grasp protein [Pseudonocardiales bacterium]
MTVLILAREFDPTADALVGALARRQVPVFRTDLCEFPRWLGLEAELREGRWSGRLWTEHREVALAEVRSIWNRNPSSYVFPSSMSAQERDFCYREARLGLGGVLASLDVLWANHPNRCADAIFKPYQWAVAMECGLSVADTMITNDPDSALRFVERQDATVTKALGPSGITEEGRMKVAYTRRLSCDDLTEMGCVSLTATTLHMNLAYAGLDFVVTPEERWVLLEVNSGPQFGWLEAATGAPMVDAMADLLMKGKA